MAVRPRVSRPEIAVKTRRRLGVSDEHIHAFGDGVDESARARLELTTCRDREDPFVAIEVGPPIVRGVALLGEPDEVVAIETERWRAAPMQLRERVSEAGRGRAI